MEIIDTHSQLFARAAFEAMPLAMRAGYLKTFMPGALPLDATESDALEAARAFTEGLPALEATIADMDEAGITRSVVVAVDAETRWNYRVSNESVAEAVAAYPERLIGFASVDPNKGDLARRELRRAVEQMGLRGLKLLPHLIELRPNDREMYGVYEEASALGVPVLLHSGTQFHSGTKLKYCRPLDVDEVAVDFPELNLIIAHFGWPWYEEAMAVVQRNRNVYFNIAGWAPKHIPPFVLGYKDRDLNRKCQLGSDYPLETRTRNKREL
ncbi:MAG: amidohydrolase family protein, partial [Candidatus Geothermincolia bacterium]